MVKFHDGLFYIPWKLRFINIIKIILRCFVDYRIGLYIVSYY